MPTHWARRRGGVLMDEYLRISDVEKLLRVRRTGCWRARNSPGFPEAIYVTPRVALYKRREVEQWMEKQRRKRRYRR